MATKDEALKLALEALESYKRFIDDAHIIEGQWHWIAGADQAQVTLKARLAEHPALEDLGQLPLVDHGGGHYTMGFENPRPSNQYQVQVRAQRTWVGLTDWERDDVLDNYFTDEGRARAIEAKLRSKNEDRN